MLQEALLALTIATGPPEDPNKETFIDSLEARGHSREYVEAALGEVEVHPHIPKYFLRTTKPGRQRSFEESYQAYQDGKGIGAYKRVLNDFVDEYEEELIQAEVDYGIDYTAVAATIVHETLAGAFTKTHGVLESLYTQFVKVPRRRRGRWGAVNQASYLFRLAQKLDLEAEEVDDIQGSYAGAASSGQFMPENLYRYFQATSTKDFYDMQKTINAVANYYQNHQETRETPPLWQEELNLGPTVTLQYHNNHPDPSIARKIGYLTYNQKLSYAVFSDKLAQSVEKNTELLAKKLREKHFPARTHTATADKLGVNNPSVPVRLETRNTGM